jgi:hypothetical protein
MSRYKAAFLALILLVGVPQIISAYTIDDNKVYIDDTNVYLSAEPHTFRLKDCKTENGKTLCPINFTLVSKKFTGVIDAVWGFDTTSVKPKRADIWKNGKWQPFDHNFQVVDKDYDGKNRWYIVNVTVQEDATYRLRIWMQILNPANGKYDFAIKKHSHTFQEAISAGQFYMLDPWYDASYTYKYEINASCPSCTASVTGLVLINDTGLILGGTPATEQWVWCNYTVTTSETIIGYLYYNDQTDYICVNSTEDGNVTMIIDQGNETDYGSPLDKDLHVWLTMNGTLDDRSIYDNTITNQGSYTNTSERIGFFQTFGNNNFIELPDLWACAAQDDFSVMGWFRYSSLSSEDYLFSGFGSRVLVYGTANNILTAYGFDGSARRADTGTLSADRWYQFAAVLDRDDNLTLYIDGQQVDTDAAYGLMVPNCGQTYDFSIGSADNGVSNWIGDIDDIRIYNRTLHYNEIMAYYNNTNGTHGFSTFGAEVSQNFSISLDSPENTTYTTTVPLTWQFIEGEAGTSCNHSAYSLNGAANVSTGCLNVSVLNLVVTGSNTLVLWVNDSNGFLVTQSVEFSSLFSLYNIYIYDEMTGDPYNTSDMMLVALCDDNITRWEFANNTLLDVQIECNLTELKLEINSSDGSHWRTLIPTADDTTVNFFMINQSDHSSVGQNWIVYDVAGEFSNGLVRINKVVPGFGEITLIEQNIDAESKVILYFIVGEEYNFEVVNDGATETRSLGGYKCDSETTKRLTISEVAFDPSLNLIMSSVFYSIGQDETAETITFYYNDTLAQTTLVEVFVWNASNISQEMYTDTSTSDVVIFTYNNVNINTTYIAEIRVTHATLGSIEYNRIVDFGYATSTHIAGLRTLGMEDWEVVFAIIVVVFTILLFGARSAPVGFGIAVIEIFWFYGMGWFRNATGLGVGIFLLLVVMMILGIIEKRRSGT